MCNRAIPRETALEKVRRDKKKDRPVFSILYDPRLPPIAPIFRKHHEVMKEDPTLAKIFPEPPLVAYRRPQSLRDKLIKSKIPEVPPARPKRNMPGQKKCLGGNCSTCPFIEPLKTVKCHISGASVEINAAVNCQTENAIYCISCNRCNQVYIGQTSKSVSQRFSQHLGYIKNYQNHTAAGKRIEPTGQHFNGPGHQGIRDVQISILEKVHSKSKAVREERESMYIRLFDAVNKGINKKT